MEGGGIFLKVKRITQRERRVLSVNQHDRLFVVVFFWGGITVEANNISRRHLMDASRVLTWNFVCCMRVASAAFFFFAV